MSTDEKVTALEVKEALGDRCMLQNQFFMTEVRNVDSRKRVPYELTRLTRLLEQSLEAANQLKERDND